mgnify:CR=1 FL=1
MSWDTKGFLVNGKEVLLRGACIHHDNGILGGCSFQEAEERRIRILKEAGFNAIRCSHNPASKDLLLACDKLGMYVMDEFTDQLTPRVTGLDGSILLANSAIFRQYS